MKEYCKGCVFYKKAAVNTICCNNTLQDIVVRYHRMKGDPTLWLPGTDHAAIATEVKIVDKMHEEGLTKESVGREGFLKRAWAWKEQYGSLITQQQRRMGSSCDWSRERFTMDEGCSRAVREVFCSLYDKGLIYRGTRLVNWCPCCNTSISDAEVIYEEKEGNFWHLFYPVKETGEMLELATTRPETMLGDTAVAINPEDERFRHLHGCHVILPLINKEIPIVLDEHADMTKGTGVVKITPAHDPNDYEVGQRNNLPIVRVFTYDGHMTGAKEKQENDELIASGKAAVNEPTVLDCGKYAGMTTMEARKAIVKDLEAGGTDISVIKDVLKEFRTGHDIKETFTQVKERMANTEEKPVPAVEEVEETPENNSEMASGEAQNSNVSTGQGITSSDFLRSIEMMMSAFTNTMQMRFDRMDKREEERKSKADESNAEDIFNAKISELENSLSNAKKELSESYSVMETKDKQIKSLRDELDDKEKLLKDFMSDKDREIQGLREEMDKMRAGNTDNGAGAEPALKSQVVSEETVKNVSVNIPNYATTMVTADGRTIPIQVERVERKSPFGIGALMSKLLPKGSAKTILTRMIEGRYSGDQLSELEFAYSRGLNEDEVNELIEANLPADEMHGIINVVAAAKGGEE